MSDVAIIARYALRESLRRRVFLVVLVLTVAFLALYALGTTAAFNQVEKFGTGPALDDKVLTASTLPDLSMFTTLFMVAVLAALLTLAEVRGDAVSRVL